MKAKDSLDKKSLTNKPRQLEKTTGRRKFTQNSPGETNAALLLGT